MSKYLGLIFILLSASLIDITLAAGVNCTEDLTVQILDSTCCDLPQWNDEDEMIEKCKNTDLACLAKCLYEETDLFTDGKLDMEKVKDQLETYFADDPELIPIHTEFYEVCANNLKDEKLEKSEKDCDTYALALSICVEMKNIVQCPKDRFKSTPECIKAKEYIENCAA